MSSWWIILLALVSPIPVGADQKVRRRPWVTYGLIAVNTAVYLATQPDRTNSGGVLFTQWGLMPAHQTATALVTYLFVHVSLAHLFGNMLFLWIFGPLVEAALRPVTFLVLYVGGGITAGLLNSAIVLLCAGHSDVFRPLIHEPLVGASGAIAAVLAPFAIRYHRSKIRLIWPPAYFLGKKAGDLELPAYVVMAIWFLWNLAGGIHGIIAPQSGGIAYWAHVGGFVFGMVTAVVTGLWLEGRQEYLLQDARAATERGRSGGPDAVEKYRAFLEQEPRNAAVRFEYGSLLARMGKTGGNQTAMAQAGEELLAALHAFHDARDGAGAIKVCSAANQFGVPLNLASRERLRLAATAQEMGDDSVAVSLLTALVSETPESAEDEMARLKLGQILVPTDPARASDVLGSLIEKYPDSDWIRMARQLLSQVQSIRR